MDTLQALDGHPIFAGVDAQRKAWFLAHAEELRVTRGETIYTPRHFRRCLGILLSGRVQVSKESLVVSVLSEGDLFGAAALFSDSEDYPTTLTALTDCSLMLAPQEAVRGLMEESARFAENYVRYLPGRIQFLSARLDALSAGRAERKLAQYLLSAADEAGSVVLSATQLSARIGVGRATLYRAFETLEKEGAISREGKTIRIRSREFLENE